MSGDLVRLDDYRQPSTAARGDAFPSSLADRYAELLSSLGPPPLLTPARGPVIIGEPPAEPPGWWVCPDCGRRRDRAGEPRTVTSVLCTGPASPYTRRHAPTEMRVRR